MKFGTLIFFFALGAAMGIAVDEPDICKDVWAYDPENNICTKEIGAEYWGWTNGRYGTSGCENCPCEDCPTPPPTPADPPTPAPTPPPVPLPQQCKGFSGGFSGDPHMLTFDQLEYDCQGTGEFHLLKSMDSDFEIQGRFRNFFADEHVQLTVGSGVVWNSADEGDPIIQVNVPTLPGDDSYCDPEIIVDGMKVENPAALTHLAPGIQILHVRGSKKSLGIEKYTIYHQQSGLQIEVTGRRAVHDTSQCTMIVQVCLPTVWARSSENIIGLLGTPDSDWTNDWKTPDGAAVTIPDTKRGRMFTEAYNYCTQWCLASESASLFTYLEKESFDAFHKACGVPADYEEMEKCVFDPPDDIAASCGRKNFACLIDACSSNLPEVGETQLESQIEMADKGCGSEIAKYDFSEVGADKLGDIQKLYGSNPFLALTSASSTFAYKFPVASLSRTLQIDFKFIESGEWDKTSTETERADYVYITIDGVQLDLMGFDNVATEGNPEEKFTGIKEGIIWERRAITETKQDFGLPTSSFGGDQLHAVTVYIPNSYYEDGLLDVKFEAKVDNPNELGGVDDFRITAYGAACDVPANPEVEGDLSVDFEKACNMQILYENFQESNSHIWGKIETMRENNYLVLNQESNMLSLTHNDLPTGADAVMFEFDVYLLGEGWVACATPGTTCANKLTATFGDDTVTLSVFDNMDQPEAEKSGFGIQWTRTVTTSTIVHVEIIVGRKYFDNGELSYTVKLDLDKNYDLALGLDELRVTCFGEDETVCPAPMVSLEAIAEYEVTAYPEMRRTLREFFASPHYMPRKYVEKSRKLFFEVDTDTCTCVCPIIPDGPTEPTTMALYFKTENESCDPESEQIGTMTMTPMQDGTIEFKYKVEPKFDLQAANIYVGETRLPVNELTGDFILPSEFPYADDIVTGQEATYYVDPTVCDFYAAIHAKVCGDFPTPPPTPPTPAPAPTPKPSDASSNGDPHFLTWGGEKFDFHGGCDLVLLDNPSFHDGLGMTIHIRTKIDTWWSYIETAVVRIGNETLEVTGGEDKRYLINGVRGDNDAEDFVFSAAKLRVHLKQASAKQLKVRIDLLNADAIGLEVFKDFVKVNAHMTDKKWKKFEGSVGMLGSYPDGKTVGRDGTTLFTDMNEYGQEWQVREDEPKLFSVVEGPQHPAKCQMPTEVSTSEKRRRLGQSMISMEDAEFACSRVNEDSRDACIFDVLATNDIEMAGSY